MTARHATIVAWQFDADDYEGGACVVFARTARAAARLVPIQDGFDGYDRRDMDERADDMHRVPKFDCHAPGPVPMSALLAAGWWFECGFCGHRVRDEGCEDCWDELGVEAREVGIVEMPDPVIDDAAGEVWCSKACADAEREERRARKEREETARARCRETLALWPEAELGMFWHGFDAGQGNFDVKLPGLRYGVTWKEADPGHIYVHPDDVATYQRLRGERRAKASVKEPCCGCGTGTLANKLGGLCGDVAEDAGVACPNRARKEKAT